ncbi:hypothetical protein [Pseudobacteriovorax antillogorgiicola]|uniref:Lipoprotein n=1 Tax=Pseudobacteriovorax antillogorgiicola TaxID=1513793 RepID=A0A1Y6B4F9_9BACT|nr:hypothetical protein [Pseudobacteriovorax antillogorgiicola]TCS59301.1 hypothetical protein EDD56_101208 [Pseudobacteriovorax antillogorgiicola]SME89601.1 hypothetical protein SAMN06296036_101278 [Pseudobacteriovorax antillogorgiicola]
MKCNLLILISLLTTSCQMVNRAGLKSEWVVLQEAKSVDCEDWPQKRSEIEILNLALAQVKEQKGFVVTARDRSGRRSHSFKPFSGGDVATESGVIDLNWGGRGRYLGTVRAGGRRLFAIELSSSQGMKHIELRDPEKNVVIHKSQSLGINFYGQEVYPSAKGFWLVSKELKEDSSRDDSPSYIFEFLIDEKKEMMSYQRLSSLKIEGDVKSAPVGDGELFLMWKKDRIGGNGKSFPKFRFAVLGSSKAKPSVYELGEEVKDRVESWTMAKHREGVLLVYVVGDTLIWENASMEIRFLDQKGDQLWAKSFVIENEHIGDPVLLPTTTFSYLLTPKWLDGESTLTVQKISATDINDLGNHGVYQEGTYLVMGVMGDADDEPFVIKQYPSGFTKKFSICEIDL